MYYWNLSAFPKCFTLNLLNLLNTSHYSKRAQTCHQTTSNARNQDVTAVPGRHMLGTESLKLTPIQWFIRFPEFTEFLFHLGKTALSLWITAILCLSIDCLNILSSSGFMSYRRFWIRGTIISLRYKNTLMAVAWGGFFI